MKDLQLGEETPPAHPSTEATTMMQLRRSTPADFLGSPGPDAETVDAILKIAARVPDHRRVVPFRFIAFEGEARRAAGAILGEAFQREQPDADDAMIEREMKRFVRAPLVVAIVSSVDRDHRTPEWEQILCAGAVCQNALIAASAYGFAAQWLTEWYAYNEDVKRGFGLRETERFAGFIYIGSATCNPKERARPEMAAIVSRFQQ